MSTIFSWNKEEMMSLLATCERDGVFPYVEKYMPKPAKVLESGSGAGRYVKYLSDRDWDVTGLEWSGDTVKMVKDVWPELKIDQGDCADSPYADNTFDGIISLGVVEHWTDGPQAPLRDMLRIMKPGGYAIVTVPVHSGIRQLKKATWWYEVVSNPRAFASWLVKGGDKPNRLKPGFEKYHVDPAYGEFFEYRFKPQEFADNLLEAGFEIVEHEPFAVLDGLYHELNPGKRLVGYDNWEFQPTAAGTKLNNALAKKRFFHPHQQVAIVRKPAKKHAAKA